MVCTLLLVPNLVGGLNVARRCRFAKVYFGKITQLLVFILAWNSYISTRLYVPGIECAAMLVHGCCSSQPCSWLVIAGNLATGVVHIFVRKFMMWSTYGRPRESWLTYLVSIYQNAIVCGCESIAKPTRKKYFYKTTYKRFDEWSLKHTNGWMVSQTGWSS